MSIDREKILQERADVLALVISSYQDSLPRISPPAPTASGEEQETLFEHFSRLDREHTHQKIRVQIPILEALRDEILGELNSLQTERELMALQRKQGQ